MEKNIGDDLSNGIATLPLINSLQITDHDNLAVLKHAISAGSIPDFQTIKQIIDQTNACNYTIDMARKYSLQAHACLAMLPASVYRSALHELIDFALSRSH